MNQKSYPYILIVCGLVGLLVSFLLTIDTMRLTENPNLDLPCNINPFISCTSVINSPQGEVFGFANPLLGIAGFSFVLAVGMMLLSGVEPSRRFWKFFTGGIITATVLIHWFIYQSIFVLGSLCLYCMITWVVTWPIFIYTIIKRNQHTLLISWYLLIILIILFRFREYFFI